MIRKSFLVMLIGLLPMAHAACADVVSDPLPTSMGKSFIKKVITESIQRQGDTINLIKAWPDAQISEALTAKLKDRTAIIFEPGHGVFVEFTGSDGTVLMWYPGNRHVVHGTWAVMAMNGRPEACYHYLDSTNPVTHVYEPTECIDPSQTIAEMGVIASRTGDIFNLHSDTLPYVKGTLDIPRLPAQSTSPM